MTIFDEDLKNISRVLSNDFLEIKNKRIFLTGGTGFVGTWLVYSFLEFASQLNAQMTLISRNPESFYLKNPKLRAHPNLQILRGDVRDFNLPAGDFDYVIHAATDVVSAGADSREVLDVNYLGTKRVLEFCRERNVRKYLFISSGAFYGRQPTSVSNLSEDYTGAPDISLDSAAYGEGKRISEWLSCQAARTSSLEVKRVRCFAMIGPKLALDNRFAVGNFINDILNSRDILIKGDGKTIRSYMYASDMTIWLWKILFHGTPSEVYNVGSDQAISLFELAQKCVASSQASLAIHRNKQPDPMSLAEHYVPSIEKAKKLGLKLEVSLDSAIHRSIEYFKLSSDH